MKAIRWGVLALVALSSPALSGPPYLTDDPVPTDLGRWEIFAFTAGEGRRGNIDGDAGLDINYGAFERVQLSATVPLGVSRSGAEGFSADLADLELGVKWAVLDSERARLSASIYPRVILPTAWQGGKTRVLLPLWVQKEIKDGATVFGGGGYMINPGTGNRNFWQAAIALSQDISSTHSIGAEITHQGPDMVHGTTQTRAGLGTSIQLSDRHAIHVSAGPTWAEHQTSFHFYLGLGLNY